MTACSFHTRRWNAVVRAATRCCGATSLAMSAIVVAVPCRFTFVRSLSLSVIRRQRLPPHHVPGLSRPDVAGAPAAVAQSEAVAARNAIASASWARGDRRAGIGGFLGGGETPQRGHLSQPRAGPQPHLRFAAAGWFPTGLSS